MGRKEDRCQTSQILHDGATVIDCEQVLFFKTEKEDPKEDSEIIRADFSVSKGRWSLGFSSSGDTLPLAKALGECCLQPVGGGTMTGKAQGSGYPHPDFAGWVAETVGLQHEMAGARAYVLQADSSSSITLPIGCVGKTTWGLPQQKLKFRTCLLLACQLLFFFFTHPSTTTSFVVGITILCLFHIYFGNGSHV